MKINLPKLSTKELATMCQRTITVSNHESATVVKNNPLLAALETVYADYDAVYVKLTYSGKSQQLADADKQRDVLFAGFKDILVGHSKLAISPFHQSAKDIYAIIEKHDIGLDRYSYAEETAQLKKLLEELSLPANAAKLAEMQLTTVVTQLTAAHTAFEQLFNEVVGTNSELRLMESATSMRQELEKALRNYLNLVKAMSSIPGWKELYAKIDELAKAVYHPKTEKAEAQVEA